MKLAFISDLHLSENSFESNQIFFSLMKKWQQELDALYILGDFFDYWLGDDDNNLFISEVEQTLKNFGKPIYFIHGNHDFVIGKKFAKRTNLTLLPDLSIIKTTKHNILISHGDAFCTLDNGYQIYKKIIRNPILMKILLQTPLKWRRKIKDLLENKSTEHFNKSQQEVYSVVNHTIKDIANKHNADIVINGHTHNPGHYVIANKPNNDINRFEIPDWCDRKPGGYILLDNEQIKIHLPD